MLKGKTVLITGAASGIGCACAWEAASLGAQVALLDISPQVEKVAGELTHTGAQVAWALADVSDEAAVNTAVAAVCDELGTIDCLVNNAGIVNNIAPLAKMEAGAWQREINTNLSGYFYCIRAVIAGMKAQSWGRIVNVSSGAARGGLFNQAGYAASKTGVIGLTHTVTLEHARHGITCNAILPGMVETENVLGMPSEITDQFKATSPARRFGQVQEIASLILYLLSDSAGYINGAEIDIDGGSRLNTSALGSRRELFG